MEAFVSRNEEDNERTESTRQADFATWMGERWIEQAKIKTINQHPTQRSKICMHHIRSSRSLASSFVHSFVRCLVLHEEFSKSMFVVFFPSFTDRIKHAQTKTEMSEGERRDATEAAVKGPSIKNVSKILRFRISFPLVSTKSMQPP